VSRAVLQPVLAGVVASIVGFASTFALVLSGLRAVGATEDEAASGLMALCVTMGVAAIWLGLRERIPVAVAWSTPGAALLISSGSVPGGWPAAVGAFVVVGALIVLAGLWDALGRWIGAIPPALASAMLAGVLLPVCVAPVDAVAELPAMALPVVLAWALLMRVARLWAVPGALVVAAAAIVIDGGNGTGGASAAPVLAFTTPAFTAGAIFSLALPLFLVTMASQNVPGISVLRAFGYRPHLRPALLGTGAATLAGAPFGGHAVNLAAITAALVAGPEAGPDPSRRWIASVTGGAVYVVFGLGAGAATALVASSPPLLVEAVAGLALLGALAGAVSAAMADADRREAAIVTFVVAASAVTVLGVSAPFWGLVAGLGYLGLQRVRRPPPATPGTDPDPEAELEPARPERSAADSAAV
jgi:benzoate membrane transport protein